MDTATDEKIQYLTIAAHVATVIIAVSSVNGDVTGSSRSSSLDFS